MRLAAALLSLAVTAFSQNLSVGSLEARAEPEWVNRLTIYEIWLPSFSAEGTLAGAKARLPHVADLGVGVVYLGPIAKLSGRAGASPYSVADYNAIDPEFGTDADLHEFVGAAHKLGLKVMLDVVYYHSAPDSNLLQEPGFFRRTPDGNVARGFWPQPLPDYTNPRVRKYMAASLVHWVKDFDVDGFRCDVAAGVPIAFWEEARTGLDRVKPNVLLLAEADRMEDQLRAFDINYNFNHYLTLRSVLRDGEPAVRLREYWERTNRTMPRGARLLHFSDNHDWRRPVLEFGEKGSLAASVLNFTLDGIPFLYNGQEIGDHTPTSWRAHRPIPWERQGTEADRRQARETLEKYKRLVRMRASQPALTSGELLWINNTEPESVLSLVRRKGADEILVILNLSNRKVQVTLDLPVMEYSSVENLLKEGRTHFQLYSGRVSAELGAYDEIVGKKPPPEPLP